MKLSSNSFSEGGAIPGEFAFAVPDSKTHATLSTNRNPDLTWSDVPTGTKSFVLIAHDRDVPSRADDVNKDLRRYGTVAATFGSTSNPAVRATAK